MNNIKDNFPTWLSNKLKKMEVDEAIFHSYILSIVEGEEPREEKLEILQSVLIETGPSKEAILLHCIEILDTYEAELSNSKNVLVNNNIENVDEKLARLLEENVQLEGSVPTYKYSEEELKIREAILSQYSHEVVPDGYGSSEDDGGSDDNLEKNTNAHAIHQAEKEKRELAKLESQKKKERDKLDREKQKTSQQEKKEARRKKAQKVEHRK